MQHEDAYSHVCLIESRYMDCESDFYKGAYGLYLAAKEAAEKAEEIQVSNYLQLLYPMECCLSKSSVTSVEAAKHRKFLINFLKLFGFLCFYIHI
ncbi:hypothetical protein NPIL_322971 [Nephila pilipes]|uniref:Uncharacterized protein n=1 Tax=Nephila pilipes TaxID=299642 RepID=A0A8X6USI3_NEPPI|nr:hypothetical protein NPIL_322971 [Nephila pilipes]